MIEMKTTTKLGFSFVCKVMEAVRFLTGAVVLLFFSFGWSQDPEARILLDTHQIRIGEQVEARLEVLAQGKDKVYFPEGQTFLPLEVVDEYMSDTIKTDDRWKYIKKYALTQFDSGSYVVPPQQVIVNNRAFYTDSFRLKVLDVAVDTTKQKMYDIKPVIGVRSGNNWWWLLLLLLIPLIWWLRKRYFNKEEALTSDPFAHLPPYDRALKALEQLDNSKYLIQSEYKGYYSDLTNILRSYLEDEVHITALESTTDELITKLELLRDAGQISLDEEMIRQFQVVLQTADLVKFARQVPDDTTIKRDRQLAESLVIRTHELLPEEEEDAMDEEETTPVVWYKKQRWILPAATLILFLMLLEGGLYLVTGSFNPSAFWMSEQKRLLQSEWVQSAYGYPAVIVETPKILKRVDSNWEDSNDLVATQQVFEDGKMGSGFYTRLSSTTFKSEEGFDLKRSVEKALSALETMGARNLIVKDDQFTTAKGAQGRKVYGSFTLKDDKDAKRMSYQVLNFVEEGGFQQLILIYDDQGSTSEELVNRIMSSIDFKTSV